MDFHAQAKDRRVQVSQELIGQGRLELNFRGQHVHFEFRRGDGLKQLQVGQFE